jgi:hypothetical protein
VSGRGASATFLYCPESVSEILGPNAEAVFEPQHLRMESGEIAGKTAVAICLLPELERNYTGGDLLYPNAQTRDLSPTQVLSDDQKQSLLGELAAIDKALTASPNDPGLLVAKAAVLQKYNLNAEAAEHLQKISGALPASVWARQLVHAAPQTPPRRDTQTQQAGPKLEEGKTYALLVGISNYEKLLKEQYLHYADHF